MKQDSKTLKDQGELYDVFVHVNDMCAHFSKKRHLGEHARGLLEVLRTIAQTALDAHRDGGIIDVHVDVYTPTALPGWDLDYDRNITLPLDGEGNDTADLGDPPF